MNTLWQDLRYGVRLLVKQPGFTLIAVITLALGIGANTAIFSLVNAVLLRPIPFPESEQLVTVWEDASVIGFPRGEAAPANYVDWKAQQSVFEDLAALSWQSLALTSDGEPERVSAYGVTSNLFPLLGVQPALGRIFLPEEDSPGASKVAILSHALWQRRYGGDHSIIGRDITLNGRQHTVVGVMPASFQFLQSYIGLWVPAAFSREELAERDSHYLIVVGRMKGGVTVEQAKADIGTITERIARDHPDEAEFLRSDVVPLHELLAGRVRRPLVMLLVAVGFVLLIACANIASLLLSRASARRREMAVRTALGANRARVVRQLLTESVLLAGAGGAAGLLFSLWSFTLLKQLIPEGMLLTAKLEIDLPVLGFTLVVSLITGMVFGLAPAMQASKIDLNQALKEGGGRAGAGAAGNRLRGAFVVAEVALALVLLVGAGLLIRTVFHLHDQYSGFQPEQLLTMRTVLPTNKYAEHPKRVAFYDQVLERVGALPGVVSLAYTTSVPLEWKGGANGFTIEGRQPEPGVFTNAIHRQISPDYFRTMGIRLRQGRYFDERDDKQSIPVVIINETMARQFWPAEDPLGKRIKFGGPDSSWMTIAGIVDDVRQMGMDVAVKAEMYLPYKQITTHRFYTPRDLVIRSAGDPLDLVAEVREEIRAVDPDQPVSNIATMEEVLSEEAAPRSLGMILVSSFAGLALLLSSLGIYGVLSYFVAQQTPEIGIRLALGAQPCNILGQVMKKGMSWALLGIAIGSLAAFALTRLMTSLLFGVSATDPATFGLVVLMLVAVALLACYLPAKRAMRVDPMVALRYE
ncbi:MAG TPA: ABC transporter permease [Blastocatellia bacterium]|nr:ABC transporter permease [Blastocatellia bacterium]